MENCTYKTVEKPTISLNINGASYIVDQEQLEAIITNSIDVVYAAKFRSTEIMNLVISLNIAGVEI